MANDTSRNPWSIDTASATDLTTDWVNVRNLQWIGASAAAQECVVTDQNGQVIWRRLAQGANQDFETEFQGKYGRPINGFRVSTLGGGTLYVTFDVRG